MHEDALIHGSCIAVGLDGVLLLGAPGAGKSDLVLRFIDHQGSGISGALRSARLVADDQVAVKRVDGELMASAPPALSGKLEIRGLGIVAVSAVAEVRLSLAVRLTPAAEIERLPDLEKARMEILGVALPLIRIDPAKASAPARIRAALDHMSKG